MRLACLATRPRLGNLQDQDCKSGAQRCDTNTSPMRLACLAFQIYGWRINCNNLERRSMVAVHNDWLAFCRYNKWILAYYGTWQAP